MPSSDARRRATSTDPASGLEALATAFFAMSKAVFAVGCGLIVAVIGFFVAGSAAVACWGLLFE